MALSADFNRVKSCRDITSVGSKLSHNYIIIYDDDFFYYSPGLWVNSSICK